MKHLSLKDVMLTMKITVMDNGYQITNPAGTAQYDAWGSRATVNGIPEYFPLSLSIAGVASEQTKGTIAQGDKAATIQCDAFKIHDGEISMSPARVARLSVTPVQHITNYYAINLGDGGAD
ncbi:hypothetical protein ACUN3I_14270 [Hafnia alvei]|uniref:hypothetical protein n=1 Tax=Hafnia alvei TaxID=569 RepID=UPI0040445642